MPCRSDVQAVTSFEVCEHFDRPSRLLQLITDVSCSGTFTIENIER